MKNKFKLFYLILNNLLKFEFCFNWPYRSNVLLYSRDTKILTKVFNKNSINKLILDRNIINIFMLILTLLKFRFSFFEYCKTYIKILNPKIIITRTDNDINFYKLKYFFPDVKFISVQNGYRFQGRDWFQDLEKNYKKTKKKLTTDYLFCFNKYYADYLNKYVSFIPIIIGSYKNNFEKLKKNVTNKKDLLFISQINPYRNDFKKFYSLEKKILPIISLYCKKKKLKLFILPRRSAAEANYIKELAFYKSLPNFTFNFINRKKKDNVYQILDRFLNILTVDSTLGYEALRRRKKVFFFHLRKFSLNGRIMEDKFAWPKENKANKNFFIKKIDKDSIFKFLSLNIKIKYSEWLKRNKFSFSDVIHYDNQNTKLKKLIKNLLSN